MNGYAHHPRREDEILNTRVLLRHLPSLSAILFHTNFSVIYTFSPLASTWEKCGVEGNLFVCRLRPLPGESFPRYALIILNRLGLNNWVLKLTNAEGVQITEQYIILSGQGRVEDVIHTAGWNGGDETGEEGKIWGIWVFEDEVGSSRGQRGKCADWIVRCVNGEERTSADVEDGSEESRRPQNGVDVDGWVDGVLPPDSTAGSGETRRQCSTLSNGFDNNEHPQQRQQSTPAVDSPDLMALLNRERQ